MDKLSMQLINALPSPLVAHFCGGQEWPVDIIDVETGLMKIDVCGKSQNMHFADVTFLRDGDGVEHDADGFYLNNDPAPAATGKE